MSRTMNIFLLLVFHVLIQQHPGQAVQSLDDFFPFGLEVGDTLMGRGDDHSSNDTFLPYMFPYFDNNHRQIYQANNGLFSFLGPISQYNPDPFPLAEDQRLISAFWSDIDTRGTTGYPSDNSVYHHVYTRADVDPSGTVFRVLEKATSFVRLYFPREPTFQPIMVIVGTWYRVGYYNSQVDKLNTFQMVLVTDESRSFVFFLYNDLQWASQSSGGPYAQAGFNAGDGITYRMLQYSRTSNITLLVNESNVNNPGLFAFRVDTTDIEAGGCTEGQALQHLPVRGQQIGSTIINFQGPCFSLNNSNILCRFGEFGTVHGMIINEFRGTCVSPPAAYASTIQLSVSFDGGETFIHSGPFTYMPTTTDILTTEEIIIKKNGINEILLSWDDTIELEWEFSQTALNGLTPESFVEIDYQIVQSTHNSTKYQQKTSISDARIEVSQVIVLATNIRPEAGRQTITIQLAEVAKKHERIIPVVGITIGVFRVGMVLGRTIKILKAVKKVVKMIEKIPENACNTWSSKQENPSTWNKNLLPCPNTLRQANVARAQYEPDKMCNQNGFPFMNCWFHKGRSQFNEDSAIACFRSVQSNEHGAAGQCCYNAQGHLITRGTGAGSDDRYHSGKTFWKHQFDDVLPFLACCKLPKDPETCNKYFEYRPSRPGSDTMGQFGGTWGDPHFLTLDGTEYTFNGYGEYTYLAIPSEPSVIFNANAPLLFESQIRTVPLSGIRDHVTAIKAFAARTESMKVSITVTRRNQLMVRLNDDVLQFISEYETVSGPDVITLRFEDFTISKNRSNDQFTLIWPIGVSMQVTPIFVNTASTLVLNVAAAVSGEFKGNWTLGLIGGYDGNSRNDLRNKNGAVIGTVESLTSENIHELYGKTWAIEPSHSLFYYETNDNSSFYLQQNLHYVPTFSEPSAGSQETTVRQACGIPLDSTNTSQWSSSQRTCYYDAAITNDVSFGRVSLQAAEEQINQRESLRNPPKFNPDLSLIKSVRIGQQVSLSFSATSEFSTNIIYKLLNGPTGSTLNPDAGQFQWNVPKETAIGSRIPVQVSATDGAYSLTSVYEVVLVVQTKNNAQAKMGSLVLLIFAISFQIMHANYNK